MPNDTGVLAIVPAKAYAERDLKLTVSVVPASHLASFRGGVTFAAITMFDAPQLFT